MHRFCGPREIEYLSYRKSRGASEGGKYAPCDTSAHSRAGRSILLECLPKSPVARLRFGCASALVSIRRESPLPSFTRRKRTRRSSSSGLRRSRPARTPDGRDKRQSRRNEIRAFLTDAAWTVAIESARALQVAISARRVFVRNAST